MSRRDDFERFARTHGAAVTVALREMGGQTFTESDRRAMVDGLEIIRVALVQPVGPYGADRVPGAVSWQEYDRATMQVVCAAMQLWLSGKLGEVECDGDR